MSHRAKLHTLAWLLLSSALIAPPGTLASSGGAALTGTVHSTARPSGSDGWGPGVQPADTLVTASGDGITIATKSSSLLRRHMRFTGTVSPGSPGRIVEIQRYGSQTHWTWQNTAHGAVRGDGSFTAIWPANHIGRFSMRAVLWPSGSRAPRAAAASPTVTVTVYRPSVATIYGPGFWGQRTACGQILRPGTLGVANRTLKCGTLISILYGGRTIVVAVIDRGPYANGADWDLTEATATALGIPGTVTLGAVSLSSR
ncbi:MAG: septal ring lytic transglycosylase RlpA family protein [Solirubrobacteraceae bacterium]